MKRFMYFKWTIYWKDNLPKDAKLWDIYCVFDEWSSTGTNYFWDWDRWYPILEPLSTVPLFWVPEEMVYAWKEYKRMPSPEEVDMFASHMIRDVMLEHKEDNEALHIKCDAIIKVVLENLWMKETLKEYEEASHKFWYS